MTVIDTTERQALPMPEGHMPRLLPIDQIQPGQLQPRKRFPADTLAELAQSIKRHGVLQPIVIRYIEIAPDVSKLEIVCGERRWRASQLAGLSHIPAIERELSDVEALELAVIENAQRQDLHPIEEAEGYKALLQAYGHGEANKQSAEDLAAKIGKSRTYIYNRIKLLDLVPDGQDQFYAGTLPTSLAEKIARMPLTQQPLALADIIKDGVCMAVREAEALLRRKYMLRLNTAPFSTKAATLVPEAGACIKCHKRTGFEPDLFADVEHNDTCTDPPCYQRKVAAHHGQVKAKAVKAGMQVIDGDNARALLKFGTTSDQLNGDYVYMDQPLKHLTDSPKSLADLLGTNLTPSALFEHPKDLTLRHIVLVTKATDALRKAELLVHDPEAETRTKKAAQRTSLDTSVATPRDEPDAGINGRVISGPTPEQAWPFPGDRSAAEQMGASAARADGDDGPSGSDVQREWAWREQAFTAVHNALHDHGHVPTDLFRLLMVRRLVARLQQVSWQLLARLWGLDETADILAKPNPLWEAATEMNGTQLDILIAELLVLGDVHPQPWALKSGVASAADSDLAKALDDPDLDIGLDWSELSKAPYPTKIPPPAGDGKGAAGAGQASASPAKDKSQAPQGAQPNTEDQSVPAHWVGQHVKVKGAKRLGQISEIAPNGDLLVAFPSGDTGVSNLHSYRSHELNALPNQTPPNANS